MTAETLNTVSAAFQEAKQDKRNGTNVRIVLSYNANEPTSGPNYLVIKFCFLSLIAYQTVLRPAGEETKLAYFR